MTDDSLAWETLTTETAYECPGFEIVREDVRLPDGTETDFDYLTENESVVVLPVTEDGAVVVIEEWRQAVQRANRGLPAGNVEDDDDDLDRAAHRELREETGYEATEVEHLASYEPANGYADSLFHYYVATGCTPAGEQDLDHDESIRVETTDYDDLLAAAISGDLRDGRSALGIMQYELRDS
jgi:ADP-ribose pyrophosphatase